MFHRYKYFLERSLKGEHMKVYILERLRSILLLVLISPCVQGAPVKITTFIPRSQGSDTARELIGWQQQLFNSYNENYCAFASTIEYTRSYKTEPIARHLFSTTHLTFAGSKNTQRTGGDIIADYFGLPTDFLGTLAIKPRIENTIIDLNVYCGLDDVLPGLYLRVHAPITHTRWTLGLDECAPCDNKFRGCTQFPPCYMFTDPSSTTPPETCPTPKRTTRVPPKCPVNPTLHPPARLRNGNCTTQSIRTALSGHFTFGDMTEPWKFGRFDFCTRSKTGLADVDIMLGTNICNNDYGHFGFFGIVVVPTGNRPKAKYIFEPIVGNGRHWEAGGGLSAHFMFNPQTDTCRRNFGIYIDGYVAHVFKTHQTRSFDFRNNGLLSRYILLKEFDTADVYNERMINAINFATRSCEVSIGLKADASAKACFFTNGWEGAVGYNIFFQECERICIHTDCPCDIDSRRFGIKGLEGVCALCHPVENGTVEVSSTSTTLNTTQQNATMFKAKLPTSSPIPRNPETICFSWNSIPLEEPTPVNRLEEQGFILADMNAQPDIISCTDLDPQSAAQGRMITHKVFGHISYTFEESCYSPHIGIGGSVEFDAHCNHALEQWAIWLKGGLTF